MSKTAAEKIFSEKSGTDSKSGDYVMELAISESMSPYRFGAIT